MPTPINPQKSISTIQCMLRIASITIRQKRALAEGVVSAKQKIKLEDSVHVPLCGKSSVHSVTFELEGVWGIGIHAIMLP